MKFRSATVTFPEMLFLAVLLCSFLPSASLQATETGCVTAAETWIDQLQDGSDNEVFRKHTRWNCEFSGQWVREYAAVTDRDRRERMCNDLVLIWTHKKCNYFREQFNPAAYEPCKAWTREMFLHCMDNDVEWFP